MAGFDHLPQLTTAEALSVHKVVKQVSNRLTFVIENNCTDYGVPVALAKSLLVEPKGASVVNNNMAPPPQLVRCWNAKPALNVLITMLESISYLSHPSEVVPLLREHNKFGVPGVTELFPEGWTNSHFSERVTNAYMNLREAAMNENAMVSSLTDTLFMELQKPGVLVLLGHRCTDASLDVLCPDLSTLLESFQNPWKESCCLTCGGRALTKHCHRFPSNSSEHPFWPRATGNDASKNKLALTALYRILEDAVWINVHTLPCGNGLTIPVVEIRQAQGYGARWSADGKEFRGFIERISPFYDENSIQMTDSAACIA